MRRLGATSSATACRDRDLPPLTRGRFQFLLDRGVLREAVPGTYYLYEHAIAPPLALPLPRPTPGRRLIVTLIFWLLIILIPIVMIEFTSH
jgi:hypothetical protein